MEFSESIANFLDARLRGPKVTILREGAVKMRPMLLEHLLGSGFFGLPHVMYICS